MPLAYVAWRADMEDCLTSPPGLESISGLFKESTNTGSDNEVSCYFLV
jgi:hypothetical protein